MFPNSLFCSFLTPNIETPSEEALSPLLIQKHNYIYKSKTLLFLKTSFRIKHTAYSFKIRHSALQQVRKRKYLSWPNLSYSLLLPTISYFSKFISASFQKALVIIMKFLYETSFMPHLPLVPHATFGIVMQVYGIRFGLFQLVQQVSYSMMNFLGS